MSYQDPIYDIPEENQHHSFDYDPPYNDDVIEDPYEVVGSSLAPYTKKANIEGYISYKYEIGTKGKGQGQFGGWVQNFTVDDVSKIIYVCDVFNNRIQLLDFPSGKYKHSFATNITGYEYQARGVAVLRDGSILVNGQGYDGNSRIANYTREGQLLRTFGTDAIGCSIAMCVDDMDRVSVIDRRKMKVMSFSKYGQGLEIFTLPTDRDCLKISANSNGHLIIPDHLENTLYVMDQYGQIMQRVRPQYGTGINFHYLGSAVADGDDNLIVCDVGNHRVMKFTSEGVFTNTLLTKREQHIWMPHDVVVTQKGHLVLSEVGSTFLKGFVFACGEYL